MKKFLKWLFANFAWGVYDYLGQISVKFIVSSEMFALFRVNAGNPAGLLIPNTTSELTDLSQFLPSPFWYEMNGTATIDIQDGDVIELRKVSGINDPTIISTASGTATPVTMNIMKVGDLPPAP